MSGALPFRLARVLQSQASRGGTPRSRRRTYTPYVAERGLAPSPRTMSSCWRLSSEDACDVRIVLKITAYSSRHDCPGRALLAASRIKPRAQYTVCMLRIAIGLLPHAALAASPSVLAAMPD